MNDIRRLLKCLAYITDQETAGLVSWKYEALRAKGEILLPPPGHLSTGSYVFGDVIWHNRAVGKFALDEKDLPAHLGVWGRTGGGKTNFVLLYVDALLKNQKPFLIFDWKQTYRGLHANGVTLYTPGQPAFPFAINPLDLSAIPEEGREGYLRHLIAVILQVYFRDLQLLSVEGVEYLLFRGIDFLRREGKKPITFLDLYRWILEYKTISREKDWKASLVNLLYKMITGPIGDVVNAETTISISELVKIRTVIELHWIGSPKDKSFLMQVLMLQMQYHFSCLPPANNLRFAIIIEEAHNVLLKHSGAYETVCELVIRQIREYGVNVCLIDQHPSLISLPALGCFCNIAFGLSTRQDVQCMAPLLALGEDAEYLRLLQIGEAVVGIQGQKPFLVRLSKAEDLRTYLPRRALISSEKGENIGFSKSDIITNKNLKNLLVDILHHPFSATSKRYKNLCLNPRVGNKLKDQLIKENLVVPVAITTPNGRTVLLDLTDNGRNHLRTIGEYTDTTRRKGGLVHQYWIATLKQEVEKENVRVYEEFKVGGGKAVDLVVVADEKRMAIEVETGLSDVNANIKKCVQSGFEKTFVVAVDRAAEFRIKNQVKEFPESVLLIRPHELMKRVTLEMLRFQQA